MPFRYTQTVVPGEAVVVFLTCSTNISSQFIGFALAQTDLALDQSCKPIATGLEEAAMKIYPEAVLRHQSSSTRTDWCRSSRRTKSTIPQPTVDWGSVKPDSLHGMMIVDLLRSQVGSAVGSVPGHTLGHSQRRAPPPEKA